MTEPDGSAIHPQISSRRFTAQAKSTGLPIIRFHDVRHSYATAALAKWVGRERAYPELIQERVRWELKRRRDFFINSGISG